GFDQHVAIPECVAAAGAETNPHYGSAFAKLHVETPSRSRASEPRSGGCSSVTSDSSLLNGQMGRRIVECGCLKLFPASKPPLDGPVALHPRSQFTRRLNVTVFDTFE